MEILKEETKYNGFINQETYKYCLIIKNVEMFLKIIQKYPTLEDLKCLGKLISREDKSINLFKVNFREIFDFLKEEGYFNNQ